MLFRAVRWSHMVLVRMVGVLNKGRFKAAENGRFPLTHAACGGAVCCLHKALCLTCLYEQ